MYDNAKTKQKVIEKRKQEKINEEHQILIDNEKIRKKRLFNEAGFEFLDEYRIIIKATGNIDLSKLFSLIRSEISEYNSFFLCVNEMLVIYFDSVVSKSKEHAFDYLAKIAYQMEQKDKDNYEGDDDEDNDDFGYELEDYDLVYKERSRKILLNKIENFVLCYIKNKRIEQETRILQNIIADGVKNLCDISCDSLDLTEYAREILFLSDYGGLFQKHIETQFNGGVLVVEYDLPSRDVIPSVKSYNYMPTKNEIKETKYTDAQLSKIYENTLYSICLRSIYEVFQKDFNDSIECLTFNGFVTDTNKATGKVERKCVLSLQVSKEIFSEIDITSVEPKACFKGLKGVSAAKLADLSPVSPILSFDKEDSRFIEGRNVEIHTGTNLASMDWEDFEQLVRNLFEMEFSKNGGEVKVTQASRDGGVDAVIFDPDPIRGGRIIVQAKRYTNTVPVSAVRDLYGTVINEGANSGILITTSDYGSDSYSFAKGKPIKLLNGGHLLGLLQKNGKSGYINISEAKELNKLKEE